MKSLWCPLHGGPALQLVMWAAGITWEGNIFRGSFGAILNASISTIRLPGPASWATTTSGTSPAGFWPR